MKKFFRLLKYVTPYWFLAALNVLFNIFSAIFGLSVLAMIVPFLSILFGTSEKVYNLVAFELNFKSIMHNLSYYITLFKEQYGDTTALMMICVLVIGISLFKTLSIFLANYFMAPIRNYVLRDIRNKMYNKILILPLSYYSNEKKGDIISRMSNDVQEIEWSIMSAIEMLFRDPFTIFLCLGTLFIVSAKLTFLVLILLPISGLIIGQVGKTLKKQSRQGQRRLGGILSIIEETLTGLRIIKAFNAEEKVNKRFESVNSVYTNLMIRLFRKRYLASPLSEFLGTLVMVFVMWYGGTLVLGPEKFLKPEAFIFYISTFYTIINPAKALSSAYYNIQKGMASSDRINEVLDADIKIIEAQDAKPISSFKSSIEYKNVSFRYEKDFVLKNINLKIEKGKTVALVGQSGSGKSTLADILPRFFDVTEGDVLIDGVSIKEYKIKDLRNLMGIVTQEPILFNDSFFNNIAFGTDRTTEEKVIEAAKVANAHEFIEKYKNDYYTNIGDRGNKLSGGQRQRVSIARAVLKNPPILILDEATSSLDTESERLVQDALTNLMYNRTSIVIAHRLSTIVNADEIIVINEGEVVERGKHDVLLAQDGIYKKLYEMQMQHNGNQNI